MAVEARVGDASRREGSRFDWALYRVRVAGRLGPEWADRVGGLTVTSRNEPAHGVITELRGRLPDQAALMGLLQQLCGRGARVLRVDCVVSSDGRKTTRRRPAS